jgi:hypothetical protein
VAQSYKPFSILLLLCICGCAFFVNSCGVTEKDLELRAAPLARDGNDINETEYASLMEYIKSNPEDLERFINDDGSINHTSLNHFLKSQIAVRFKDKNISIWQPGKGSEDIPSTPFNINVYIENSESMDGYVRDASDFRNTIYNFLADLNVTEIVDSLNLNYINTKQIKWKSGALPTHITDFIEKLNPETFKVRGGDRTGSDIKNVLSNVLSKVDDNNASILISDYVFSPGKHALNAEGYLVNQEVGIKMDFNDKLKKHDLSVLILHLQAPFKGDYFNKYDKRIPLEQTRPYYIWILGTDKQIQEIITSGLIEKVRGNVLNTALFTKNNNSKTLEYKVQKNPRIGSFELNKEDPKKSIVDAKVESRDRNKGEFSFTIAVDFSKAKVSDRYFEDASNYKLSNNDYTLKASSITDNQNPALKGFTHYLTLTTSELKSEELIIEVLPKTPSWVYQVSSDDDTDIKNTPSEHSKTFGFKYLVDGVASAYHYQLNEAKSSSTKSIAELTIKIKK